MPRHPAGPPTPAAEQSARQDVRTRLERRFPDVPSETPATTAAEAFVHFTDARVRHYRSTTHARRRSGLVGRLLRAEGCATGLRPHLHLNPGGRAEAGGHRDRRTVLLLDPALREWGATTDPRHRTGRSNRR
ncbi:three-helix bundle dimerization domain-containing protein [Streptomyces sp. GQFP]|uniref:three-helix bundle dimerization domain-containing protein n=1 Tax=Streptomyces sp. GQFP TaxID=2907545 RepID=UPI003FA7C1D0